MTYSQEDKCCEPSLFKSIVTTCYEVLLRPLHNRALDTIVYQYTGFKRDQVPNAPNAIKYTTDNYTQEDEEQGYTFGGPTTYYNDYYNDTMEHTSSTNKRKQKDFVPEPHPYIHKMPRSNTYSNLRGSNLKPPTVERRRCESATVPSSYTDLNEFNKEKRVPIIIQCQYCEKKLGNDVVYVGADMTFCSSHCRRNTFHSYLL